MSSKDLATAEPQSDAMALMAVISRAASDPNTDVGKLERLMSMYERIQTARAKAAYDEAFAEMQPHLPAVDKNGRITIRDRADEKLIKQSTPYALFEDINEAILPIIAQYGFGLSFRVNSEAKIKITAILSHKLGHREETTLELPHDSTGSKNAVQAVGSSVKYGQRYTMCAILNITTRGDDDDGKLAGSQNITAEQAAELTTLINTNGISMDGFLKNLAKVPTIAEIPTSEYQRLLNAIRARIAEKNKGQKS